MKAKWERCLVDRSRLVKFLNAFTHPSATKRLRRLETRKFPLAEASFFSGVLYSSSYVFMNYMHQLAAREFDVQSESIFAFGHEAYRLILSFRLAELLVLFTALVYVSSIIAFTVDRHGLLQTVKHIATFLVGTILFRWIGAFPRFDVLNDRFWQIWLERFWSLWSGDVLLVMFFFCLWNLNKRVKGKVDEFSLYTNAIAAILGVVMLSSLTS